MTEVYFSKESRKIFEKLKDKRFKTRVTHAIRKLSSNSGVGKKLQGKLDGTYSIRVWPYRILYEITAKKDIIIIDISPRMPGSPGIASTPYSNYLYGRPVSVGERVAMEIKQAIKLNNFDKILS